MMRPLDGRRRVLIETLRPMVDGGAAPIKRTTGESVTVEADVLVDGHDRVACRLLHRAARETRWREVPMEPSGADTWRGRFTVTELGLHRYTVSAWVDPFASWLHTFARRVEPADIADALVDGAAIVRAAAGRAGADATALAGAEAAALAAAADRLDGTEPLDVRRSFALSPDLGAMLERYPDRSLESVYERELTVAVERPLARYSSWYEFFPRSCGANDAPHGTFADAEARLAYVARMGFDVVYLPPIHPIGRTKRKGRNNALAAAAGDPGSPWAIGAREGGHDAVHPKLGTLEDFHRFRDEAVRLGLEVALDVAFQCSPDHPYVSAHPEWFRLRHDGSVQYAENPPKKYEDIYPFDFTTGAWRALWDELRDVVEFWIEQGVTVFRVDNPHTKPFAFWQWLIADVKERHPETIFLSEAFSRPRVMYRLAKLGFSQSYTYFTWRNTKHEIMEYFTDIAGRRDYFRPNLWPNTPDILHEYLQFGGRPAFVCRAVLAATLGANYGIYGPAFELLEATPRDPGSEEYLDSEKYQLRRWDLQRADSLSDLLARLNAVRRENPALQSDATLAFRDVDNEQIVCYSKHTEDLDDIVLVVVNLDPHHVQSGFVDVPIDEWRIDASRPYQAHDLLSDARYLWNGRRNFVLLDPQRAPAHVLRIRRHVRTEHDFDYFM
jgi:starch synthase (maltosyl-transferring)